MAAFRSKLSYKQEEAIYGDTVSTPRVLSLQAREDFLEKGFQLACFIISDRAAAIGILSEAMNKLKAQMGREKKRAYWRDKFMKRWITSVTRGDADTLQWLIYLASEAHEKEQERSDNVSIGDLILRYIKSIVQMTTATTSFHVCVGMSRVLHHYDTAETQRMYELVSQRYLGADQFRRAKRLLLDKLQARFGKYLKTVTDRHGEIKFETLPDQRRWADLASECLAAFTPWSTASICRSRADSLAGPEQLTNSLSTAPQSKVHYDTIEMNRCHVFIEPACFGRLASSLGLGAPDRKLALPKFFAKSNADGESRQESPSSNQPLTTEERKRIGDNLSRESGRRRGLTPRSLRFLVDGAECAQLDLLGECDRRIEIVEGARLVEIWSRDEEGGVLLATHLISYSEQQDFVPFRANIRFKNAATLSFAISPQPQDSDAARRASLVLHYSPASPWFAGKSAQKFLLERPLGAAGYALAGVALVAVGWFLAEMKFQRQLDSQRIALEETREQLRAEKVVHPSSPQNPAATAPSPSIAFYRLIPDDLGTRGAASVGAPTVFVSKSQIVVSLELPLSNNANRSYRAALKSFPEQHEILTESLLAPSRTGPAPTVTFTFPASLVRDGRDYTIVLDSVNSAGKTQEENTFTFHVVRRD